MKIILPLIFVFSTAISSAIAQGSFYNDLDSNKRCIELKNELKTLLNKNAIEMSYDNVLNFMKDYDLVKINGENYIWDIYSYNPNGAQPYTYKPGDNCNSEVSASSEGKCWNREHVFAASWFSNQTPMYTDIVNLLPTDGYVNNKRSNNPFARVSNPTFISKNSSKLGSSTLSQVPGTAFEPLDEFKGDVARILLYMSVRYADEFKHWNNADFTRIKGTDDLDGYKSDYLNMLVQWHHSDPPSKKERDRNEKIYSRERVRNPFVDYPQLVDYIWESNNCIATRIPQYEQSYTLVYPLPATDFIYLKNSTDAHPQTYYISDLSGRQVQKGNLINQNSISISGLSNGVYFLFIHNGQQDIYSKFIVAH